MLLYFAGMLHNISKNKTEFGNHASASEIVSLDKVSLGHQAVRDLLGRGAVQGAPWKLYAAS